LTLSHSSGIVITWAGGGIQLPRDGAFLDCGIMVSGAEVHEPKVAGGEAPRNPKELWSSEAARVDLWQQTYAMWRYARDRGLPIDDATAQTLIDETSVSHVTKPEPAVAAPSVKRSRRHSDLQRAHTDLARVISPAQPRTVLLLEDERRKAEAASWWQFHWLGPVPIVRYFVGLTVLALISFVLLVSFSPTLRDQSVSEAPTTSAFEGYELPIASLALRVSAAAPATAVAQEPSDFTFQAVGNIALFLAAFLGVMFSILWQIHQDLERGVYSPQENFYYLIQVVLGLVAGVILALLVPLDEIGGIGPTLTKSTLALLGGFSASAVHQILTTLVGSLKSVFSGGAEERLQDEMNAERAAMAAAQTKRDVHLAQDVMRLRPLLTDGGDGDDLVSGILARLAP
jgi:hypothetical protein